MTKPREDDLGHYSMIIEWEPEGGAYVVTVPELPGCRTHGATRAEAIQQAREVIELWIESARADGHPVPPPRHFAEETVDAPLTEPVPVG